MEINFALFAKTILYCSAAVVAVAVAAAVGVATVVVAVAAVFLHTRKYFKAENES